MAISRNQKEKFVSKLKDVFKNSKTIVFVNFSGINVNEINKLRESCLEDGVSYMVAKKSLINKSLSDVKFDGEIPNMEGEIALAYGDDQLAPARLMGEQSKLLKNKLKIVGGIFENSFKDGVYMQSIADIPPIKTLYTQFLNVIKSPISGFASVIDQVADKK